MSDRRLDPMSLCQIALPVCTEMPLAGACGKLIGVARVRARSRNDCIFGVTMESRRTVPGTRDAFARTGSVKRMSTRWGREVSQPPTQEGA